MAISYVPTSFKRNITYFNYTGRNIISNALTFNIETINLALNRTYHDTPHLIGFHYNCFNVYGINNESLLQLLDSK